jgi:hypothetical protein
MKRLLATIAAATLLQFAPGARARDFDFDRFKPTTLAAAKADFLADARAPIPGVPDKIHNKYFDQGGRGWRARAAYTGQSRPLEAEELAFIRGWLKSVGHEEAADTFTTSYLFTADGKDYWLPVEGPVAAFFPKELRPGDVVDLYLAEIGGAHAEAGWIWLPLVEEFQKPDEAG